MSVLSSSLNPCHRSKLSCFHSLSTQNSWKFLFAKKHSTVNQNRLNLIFDLSEVLIPGLFGIEKILSQRLSREEEEILRAFEAPPFHCHGKRFHRWMTGKLDFRGFGEEFSQTLNLQPESIEILAEECRNCFFPPYPTTIPLLNQLSQSHQLFLISDHMEPFVEELESHYDFLSLFSRRIWSCQIGSTKSEGTPFEILIREESLTPENCLFIDDHPPNLEIAESFGLNTFHFTGGDSTTPLMETINNWRPS